MVRLIVVVGMGIFGALQDTPNQFNDSDLMFAIISMTRENRCGFEQPSPTDIHQCPTYSIAISGDGSVTYEGRAGVKTLGKRTHKVALPNGGIQVIDHDVATTLSVSIGDRTKSVYDFYGAPDVVRRLEERVDQITDSRRYTGG